MSDHIDDKDKYADVEPGAYVVRPIPPAVGLNPKDIVGAKKAPLSLVPPALVIGAAEAMAIGADKYGPFNWREQPIQYMTYIEAMQRHLAALVDGQDLAEDTGVHHLKHVLAGGAILLDAIENYGVVDNRPPSGPAALMLRTQDKSAAYRPVSPERAAEIQAGIDRAVLEAKGECCPAEGTAVEDGYCCDGHNPVVGLT